MYHCIAEALCEGGLKDEAVKLVREYWGKMLELGADTFWEAFDPDKPGCRAARRQALSIRESDREQLLPRMELYSCVPHQQIPLDNKSPSRTQEGLIFSLILTTSTHQVPHVPPRSLQQVHGTVSMIRSSSLPDGRTRYLTGCRRALRRCR